MNNDEVVKKEHSVEWLNQNGSGESNKTHQDIWVDLHKHKDLGERRDCELDEENQEQRKMKPYNL